MKLKYALPLVQMFVAWILVRWDNALQLAAMHRCEVPGPSSPAFGVLISINAPIAFPRAIWDQHLPYFWSFGMLVAAVGLFWYWVVLNAHALRQRGMVLMFSWRPARLVMDTVLFASGIMIGLWGASGTSDAMRYLALDMHGRGCYGPNLWFQLASIIVACILLSWSFVLVFFFGRDFIHCARGTTRAN
jgi:hypothetical protein